MSEPTYKITFTLRSPISFTDRPTFDALLAWCWLKAKNGVVASPLMLAADQVERFDELPLIRHPDGYFLASWMQFDATEAVEFTGSWKKRWDNRHDHLVSFGKKVRKVRINAGEFKSYDMPLVLHNIRQVWFFFASPDVLGVERLVNDHLWGIGKKTSQGYGEIERFKIEPMATDPFADAIIRPIPATASMLQQPGFSLNVQRMGYRPPYWLPENQTFCLKP